MRLDPSAGDRIHRADCDIWDTPADAMPEALIASGIEDEDVVRYCAAARPVYDAYKRVLGQLSGVLLLAQTGADDPAWRDRILDAAGEQLAEARERLGALRSTPPVARHHDLLAGLAEQLAALHARLRRAVLLVGADRDWDRLVSELYATHRRLLAASEPRAGMTPVDFSHACCSCGAPRRLAAEASP
jgi:hypothetical protein